MIQDSYKYISTRSVKGKHSLPSSLHMNMFTTFALSFTYPIISEDHSTLPNQLNGASLLPTLPCTFTWDTTYNSIEPVDSEEPDWLPLPTDLAVAALIPSHLNHSIKWAINRISIPLGPGDLFWFYFDYDGQELRSTPLMLGKQSAIHYFIGRYALVDISPMLHYDWDQGWIKEEGDTFWMNVQDLVLSPQQRQDAQRAYLQDPTFTLLNSNNE
jgi:hypothetical protein